ncbi:MAG TPA: hypothetical protein VFC67_21935 [Prolixibacteraceae bacterium]|nr:hypothetical protein [Prolixibacteraceae bacterium]
MNSKSKLQVYFDSKRENSEYIDMYEKNLDFFNDLLLSGRKEEIEYVLPIKMFKYADSLNLTGNHKKAFTVLNEIDRDLEKLKGRSKWYNQYFESLTFLKGVCLGRLKKYRKSNIEFEKLLRKKPDNDNFKDWFKTNKKKQIGQIFDSLIIIAMIYYFAILILGFIYTKLDNFIIRDIGLIIAISSYSISYFWKKTIDKATLKFT